MPELRFFFDSFHLSKPGLIKHVLIVGVNGVLDTVFLRAIR